jgi:hypothetical protein
VASVYPALPSKVKRVVRCPVQLRELTPLPEGSIAFEGDGKEPQVVSIGLTAHGGGDPVGLEVESNGQRTYVQATKATVPKVRAPPKPQRAVSLEPKGVTVSGRSGDPVIPLADSSGHIAIPAIAEAQLALTVAAPCPQ